MSGTEVPISTTTKRPRVFTGVVELEDGGWGIGPRPERASEDPDRADVDMAHSIGLDGC